MDACTAGAGAAAEAGVTTSKAAATAPSAIPIFPWRIGITVFLGLRLLAEHTASESTKGLDHVKHKGKKELEPH